uniref:cysteine--tRNA ligase n=1 Tax=Timema californicum TaxID=61474 RepID=A0A7R9JD09_TIMCA|nr:unnamed protein product [Timema californicum]
MMVHIHFLVLCHVPHLVKYNIYSIFLKLSVSTSVAIPQFIKDTKIFVWNCVLHSASDVVFYCCVHVYIGGEWGGRRDCQVESIVALAGAALARKWQCASVRTQSNAKWILPSGHDTNIYVYNCITKKKVPLILKNPNYASWYMCGPTVYDSAHIGHAWYVCCSSKFSIYNCYMKFDIIRRILCNHFDINVVMVMGITDIDDKIIHRAAELGEDINTLTRRFEAEFHEDMAKLNIKPATIITRVTDFVPRIIAFVQEIVDKGNGYVTVDGSVYFDTSQFDRYGKLFPVSMNEEPAQPTVDKKSPLDFALWKGAKPNEPSWLSPWGPGRPGWHIECSTMASAMFGRTMDLHSGGVDLLFPHHENEEAQSCVHHGVSQWVNYWLHSGHLHLKGDTKMSKSLKNTISIRDFLTKFTANEFRVFCLLSRYRNGVEYTDLSMENAVAVSKKLESFLEDADAYIRGVSSSGVVDEPFLLENLARTQVQFLSTLANDFDTAKGLGLLLELISITNRMLHQETKVVECSRRPGAVAAVSEFVRRTLNSLGTQYGTNKDMVADSPLQMERMVTSAVNFRNLVRELALLDLKDSKKQENEQRFLRNSSLLDACDTLRKDFLAAGVQVKDHGKLSSWSFSDSVKSQL